MAYGKAIAALADPTRLQVFEKLRKGPAAVGTLAQGLRVSRPAVSQHLKVLEGAGLVEHRSRGTRNLYAVAPAGLAPLQRWLTETWDDTLGAFAAYVEQHEKNPEASEEEP